MELKCIFLDIFKISFMIPKFNHQSYYFIPHYNYIKFSYFLAVNLFFELIFLINFIFYCDIKVKYYFSNSY